MRFALRIAAFFAALATALSFTTPALADPPAVHGCTYRYICFWNWYNYNDAGGKFSLGGSTVTGSANQCYNLNRAHYSVSGITVDSTATSFVSNIPNSSNYIVQFHNYPNCDLKGGGFSFKSNEVNMVYSMTFPPNPWGDYNDSISSVSIRCCF